MIFQTPIFIFMGIFSLFSALLFLIYNFGIKRKSYEEALAEQRHQTQIFLGSKNKPPKEKKNKKVVKKGKEKVGGAIDNAASHLEEEANQDVDHYQQKHAKGHHVEFKETPEVVLDQPEPSFPISKKLSKKEKKEEKVRPVLKPSAESVKESNTNVVNAVAANHFEDTRPKDDAELQKEKMSEDLTKQHKNVRVKKISKTELEEIKKAAPTPAPKEVIVQKEEQKVATADPPVVANANIKENKKRKNDALKRQQLVGDVGGPGSAALLLNSVRKAELSRSDIQILIDLLLNKQLEAPTVLDEWTEGKSDPVQKLKKQLAEKEQLLEEEHLALLGAQAKVREARAQQQAERGQLGERAKRAEEALHASHAECGQLRHQMQQLQAQLKDEMVVGHKLREEIAALQRQRQQMEMRVAQSQESDVYIAQLQGETSELSTVNNHIRMELARLTEESNIEKDRQQNLIVQLNNMRAELDQKIDFARQLEEVRLDLERKLEHFVQRQHEDLKHFEVEKKTLLEDNHQLQMRADESNKLIYQLKTEIQKLQEEQNILVQKNTQVNGTNLQENEQREMEILNLRSELKALTSRLNTSESEYELEIKSSIDIIQKLQVELEEQRTKNNELRTRNWKVMEALSTAESRIKSRVTDVQKHEDIVNREFLERLFPEIKAFNNSETFLSDTEKLLKNYVKISSDPQPQEEDFENENGDEPEAEKLKLQLQHYKNVIDNTDQMLKKLQKNIEQGELTLRMELAAKSAEIETIKQNYSVQLSTNVEKLEQEQAEKQTLLAELQYLKNASSTENNAQSVSNGVH